MCILGKGIEAFDTVANKENEFHPKPLTVKLLTPLFTKTLETYKKLYKFDLSYMSIKISDIPLNTNGEPSKSTTKAQFGGCWTTKQIIYINPHFELPVKYYEKVCDKETYMRVLKTVIAHELAHEIYTHHASMEFKKEIQKKIRDEHFTTSYIQALDNTYKKYDEECFCEYLAAQIYQYVKNTDVKV